ncbi:putative mycofactocin system creatinine amidohydrolase family protein MftE [Streptomyces sp. RB17]|uniref:mycofactocin biosynthesis peptidyl-dipeptidase MftE n=1 Tax=Streptomyces sp. RB17 TaxID=2585197 RepID=UPI001297C4A4|nr:mycofactocin biosynthesis peptidyl-dipeptidase MftE [Streptomyces sp. RB17]MQY33887.1 putative mycofactocin system creatinine amidohydrolase family protein MftE [Streptomyces sp. RB17]
MTALASLTWTDVADQARRRTVLAVPVGATEQHGPHLPMSTDTDIAVALAERLTAQVPDVVVAPAVAFGSSGEHQGFPGTLSIGQEAVELLLVELVRSATVTFPRVVLVSAHGGNAQPVHRAVRRLRTEGRHVLAWGPRWGGDAHAGRTETSVMLALAPHLVRMEAARAGNTAPVHTLLPRLREAGLSAFTANGVLGDPGGANAEEGRLLIQRAVADLADLVTRHRRHTDAAS